MKTEPKYEKRKYLSISTLLKFARCPRLFFYEKCGLEPNDEMLAAKYGSCHHKGIPVAAKTWDRNLAMNAFMEDWDESIADEKRNMKCALRSIEHFIHTHQGSRSLYTLIPPPIPILQVDDRVSEFEVPWAIDIGLSVPLVGRLDSFCTVRDSGKLAVWELKTASRMNDQFFDQFDMNAQILTYGLVAQTLIGETIDEVYVEGILVDAKKVDNQTQPVRILPHHLEAQLRWLQNKGSELLECERRLEENPDIDPARFFLQDFSHCTAYTHYYIPSYRCNFTEMCRVADWKSMKDIYRVKEDHQFIDLNVDPNAIRKIDQPVQVS